jgi:hypothetical protein
MNRKQLFQKLAATIVIAELPKEGSCDVGIEPPVSRVRGSFIKVSLDPKVSNIDQ